MAYRFQPIEIDKKGVEQKLNGTQLGMKKISKKMMNAVNKEVIREAKINFRSSFDPKNHSWQYEHKYKGTKVKPTLSSFKYKNDSKQDFVSYVRNLYYVSVFNEFGADYIFYKKDGQTRQIRRNPKPFIDPAVKDYWATEKARAIMEGVLEKNLDDYWERDIPLSDKNDVNADK